MPHPLGASDATIQLWETHIEPWKAFRQRYRVSRGATMWPECGKEWDTGIITGATATQVTDSTKAWQVTPQRWVAFDGTGLGGELEDAPAFYDVVIYPDTKEADPWQVIQLEITSHTGTTLTLAGSLADFVTTGQIAAVGDVVGWRWVIVKHGQYNWADRWPQWHNPREWAYGTASGGATDATHIQDLGLLARFGQGFTDDVIGKDVLFQTAAGAMRRCTITARTDDTITFTNPAGGAIDTAGRYTVVDAGAGPARPDRPHYSPHTVWDWSYARFYWTVHPHALPNPPWSFGRLGPVALPTAYAAGWSAEVAGSCAPATKYARDEDLKTEADDPCNDPDVLWAPYLYRTWRGMQRALLRFCLGWAELGTHEGATSIADLVPATMLWKAGINAFTGTTGSMVSPSGGASTQIQVTGITLPAGVTTPVNVHFGVRNERGIINTGHGAPGSAGIYNHDVNGGSDSGRMQWGVLSGSGPTYTLTFTDASPTPTKFSGVQENRPAVFSLGFTRYAPWAFRWMFDRTVFVPDLDGGGEPVVPPTASFPGSYYTRPKSTAYVEQDELGDYYEGPTALTTGRAAWYLGDNWYDVSEIFGRVVYDGTSASMPADAAYRANLYEGAPPEGERAAYEASLSGAVDDISSDSVFSVRDSTKAWATAVVSHTGTATHGTATSLRDTSKAGDSRWDGTGGRWVGHTIRVTIAGVTYRRLVTAYDAATQQLAWDEPLPAAVSAGDAYQIVEWEVLNRWKGRTVTLSDGGVQVTATITGNDDTTLYLDTELGVVAPAGTAFRIHETPPGGVYQWDGTRHAAPTGADGRTGGQPWVSDTNFNHPHVRKLYGLAGKMDLCQQALSPRNEIGACLAQLKKFTRTHGWRHHPTDPLGGTNQVNYKIGDAACAHNVYGPPGAGPPNPDYPHASIVPTLDAAADADAHYDAATGSEQDDAAPFAIGRAAATNPSGTVQGFTAGHERRFAYGRYDLGYEPKGVDGYTATAYVWTVRPGGIPLTPSGDLTLHPSPTSDPYGWGPGEDTNSPNERVFDAMGDGVLCRQMHAWHSHSSPAVSGGAPERLYVTDVPLGSLAQTTLPDEPNPPVGTNTNDVRGYQVTEATWVFAPFLIYCV